jgi:hypothetical protein
MVTVPLVRVSFFTFLVFNPNIVPNLDKDVVFVISTVGSELDAMGLTFEGDLERSLSRLIPNGRIPAVAVTG